MDNDLKVRQVLQEQFPAAKTLLCIFHVLKAVWSWLREASHGVVDRYHRQELYFLFKALVYAANEQVLNERYGVLHSSKTAVKYGKYTKYVEEMWKNKDQWVLCYRKGLAIRGSNTTNYLEIVFWIVKDNILDRTQTFNVTQLVDFILTRYESYTSQRLLDFCNSRYNRWCLRMYFHWQTDLLPRCE